jgi:DNA-directed RNA polymerase subunit RPC12/RpoP
MARGKRREPDICPRCGARAGKPVKTWQLVSPLPDSKGRITITVMGIYECPKCGYRWRGVLSKVKAGGGSVEVEAGEKKSVVEEEAEERAEVIELSLDDILEEE